MSFTGVMGGIGGSVDLSDLEFSLSVGEIPVSKTGKGGDLPKEEKNSLEHKK